MKKISIVTTHAIQYNAPWFKLLGNSKGIDLKVFYTWSQTQNVVKDKNFGKEIKWDIPLLEGYNYEFVENVSKNPGSHHFNGIDNPELIQKIKAFDPDMILVFGWKLKSNLKVLRYFKGKVPVWFRGDSTLMDENSGLKTFLRGLVLRWVYKHIDKALYVGSANKDYFLHYGLKNNQLIYAPHAVDNDRFMGQDSDEYDIKAEAWRQKLEISKNDIVILYAGKFEPKKQPDFLLNAVIEANKRRKQDLTLVMVGQGTLKINLKTIAGKDNSIKFVPFINQKEMPVVYRIGDVFCLPSRGPGETWGLAVNEAMASGRTVIVSDKVGCKADLVNPDTGWVFEHDNIKQLIDLLVTLEPKQLEQKAMTARKHVKNFSYNDIINSITLNLN